MFKKLALSLVLVSVTALSVYTIKLHRDTQLLLLAVDNMTDRVDQYVTDIQFAEIVEGFGDINNG